jgi:hypothetical protein
VGGAFHLIVIFSSTLFINLIIIIKKVFLKKKKNLKIAFLQKIYINIKELDERMMLESLFKKKYFL